MLLNHMLMAEATIACWMHAHINRNMKHRGCCRPARNDGRLTAALCHSPADRLVTEVTESRSGSPTRRDRDEDAAGDGQRRLPKTTVLNVNDLKAQVDQEALQAPGAAGTAAVLPAANGVAAPAAALPPAVPAAPPLQPPALPAQPPAAALPVPAPLREPSPPLQAVVETEPLVDDNVRLECLKVRLAAAKTEGSIVRCCNSGVLRMVAVTLRGLFRCCIICRAVSTLIHLQACRRAVPFGTCNCLDAFRVT